MKYFDDAETEVNEVGTFMWPETKSIFISPLKNDTGYFIRSFPVDNSSRVLTSTNKVSYYNDGDVGWIHPLLFFKQRYFNLYLRLKSC